MFDTTWWLTPDGLVTRGAVFPATTTGFVVLALANMVGILMVGMYALGLSRDRRDAKQRLHAQAWQLRQLVPR